MIYITQLIYLKPGREKIFHQFEDQALPALTRYRGSLLLRIRPGAGEVIAAGLPPPYEVHFLKFETEQDFKNFMNDEGRKQFLHLKEASVQSVLLVQGTAL